MYVARIELNSRKEIYITMSHEFRKMKATFIIYWQHWKSGSTQIKVPLGYNGDLSDRALAIFRKKNPKAEVYDMERIG